MWGLQFFLLASSVVNFLLSSWSVFTYTLHCFTNKITPPDNQSTKKKNKRVKLPLRCTKRYTYIYIFIFSSSLLAVRYVLLRVPAATKKRKLTKKHAAVALASVFKERRSQSILYTNVQLSFSLALSIPTNWTQSNPHSFASRHSKIQWIITTPSIPPFVPPCTHRHSAPIPCYISSCKPATESAAYINMAGSTTV
jgi:hypothetical protein